MLDERDKQTTKIRKQYYTADTFSLRINALRQCSLLLMVTRSEWKKTFHFNLGT